jgi:hypothetical protein
MQRSDAGETLFNSEKKCKQAWMTKNYFAKLANKINEGNMLPSSEIKSWFDNLNKEQHGCHEAGAEWMEGMLSNIDELI